MKRTVIISCSLLIIVFICFLFYNFNNIIGNSNDNPIYETGNESLVYEESSLSVENTIFDSTTDYQYSDVQDSIIAENDDAISSEVTVDISTEESVENSFYAEMLSQEIIDKIYGISYKDGCPVSYDDLRHVCVLYYDFNNNIQKGELICNKKIAQDFVEIFYELFLNQYQFERIHLVDEYNADDKLSMIDNNTSCFNFRPVEGTNHISKHGYGMAIDINPFYNPYVTKNSDGSIYISPPGSEFYAVRENEFSHKITEEDLCYKLFKSHGFKWGGHYKTLKDYQHFYKED